MRVYGAVYLDTNVEYPIREQMLEGHKETAAEATTQNVTPAVDPSSSTTNLPATTASNTPSPDPTASSLTPAPPNPNPGSDLIPLPPTASSWWNYVGWGTAPQSAPAPPPPATEVKEGEHDVHAMPIDAITPALDKDIDMMVVTTTTVPVETADRTTEAGEAEVKVKVQTDEVQDGAVVQSTSTSGVGVWYSPWSWYAPGAVSGNTGDAASEGVGEGEGDDANATGGVDALKDRDKVQPEVVATEATVETNPVASTFATSRVGWASFLSSGSLAVKRITGSSGGGEDIRRDEHGAEVMDIDEDAEVEASPVDGVEKQKENGSPGEVGDEGSPLKKRKETERDLNEDEMRRGRQTTTSKPKPVAPPLTISDSVKRQTIQSNLAKKSPVGSPIVPKVKKSTSPAPSTRSTASAGSGRSTPAPVPKPPNMVLPAWQDTFHTAPRSVVPSEPETVLSRAMGFVSGVLFTSEGAGEGKGKGKSQGQGKGKGKGKGRDEREREWLHFGKELPRAWDVVEGRVGVGNNTYGVGKGKGRGAIHVDLDVLRGCTRVVVIGIHGWFPGKSVVRRCGGGD